MSGKWRWCKILEVEFQKTYRGMNGAERVVVRKGRKEGLVRVGYEKVDVEF